jgi:zona occludens toxin
VPYIGTRLPDILCTQFERTVGNDNCVSYGKLNAAIRDLIQIVYRVRKNVALGSSGSYVRKLQGGIRGEVVNTSIRRYDGRYFPLYQSHTKSAAGLEMGAADIIPFWRHWTFYGMGACVVAFLVVVAVRGKT